MRFPLAAAFLFQLCSPMFSWADFPAQAAHAVVPAAACPCTQCAPAMIAQPVVAPPSPCSSCDPCAASGSCAAYAGLSRNYAEFYRVLYAEFYAKNPWYLEAKQREAAARRERLFGTAANPQPQAKPVPNPAMRSILK